MPPADAWARTAAALPQSARRERERPFWLVLRDAWHWRKVADIGCGAGFHLALLADLGVAAFGIDLALGALASSPRGRVAAADLLAPPLRSGRFDGVLCLGNTLSLLPTRATQRQALGALAALLAPDGVLLLQGEDAATTVTRGPVARLRRLADGGVHVRVFVRRGRHVEMLAAVGRGDGETDLATTSLLPTGPRAVRGLARSCGLAPLPLPVPPPGAAPTWWVALAPARG